MHPGLVGAHRPRHRRQRIGHIGEHVEEVALLGVNQLLHRHQFVVAEILVGQAVQEFRPRVGRAPEDAEFGFALEEIRQLAKEQLHELLRAHRRAVGMPEGCHHHVLDDAFLSVGELHPCSLLLFADATNLPADFAGNLGAFAGRLAANFARLGRWNDTGAGTLAALRTGLRLHRVAVPFRVAEMVVRLHEVVDREIILPLEEPRAAPDDLLELDHRIDGPHQHDVADVPGIHAGAQLLGRGQDGRDGFFVVLKIPQPFIAPSAFVRRHTLAIVRLLARFELIDEVAHNQRVGLIRAEDQRLLALVDL